MGGTIWPVKSAFDFRSDAKKTDRIDADRWARVAIPIRIITTRCEELIRQITISNNRQNQISASALRANDSVQLDIEQRLRSRGIFYERQRGALDELLASNTARLDQYRKSNARAVRIEDVARCLAATAADFDLAHSPSHLFEYDAAYERVFAPEHLASTTLIVLLQNLHDVIPAIVKNDLGLEPRENGPRKTRLIYYVLCLLMRYLAKNKMHDWAAMYGGELLGRQSRFREDTASLLGNYRSKIKQSLKNHFMTLNDSSADSMREAFKKAAWELGLRDTVDAFEVFADLDERMAERM